MDIAATPRAERLKVRTAEPGDLPWILQQLREFSEFMGTIHPLFGDEDYAHGLMLKMMSDHVLMVAQHDRGLAGLIAGFYLPHPFNPKIRSLAETFFWVSEDFRQTFTGGLAATQLLDSFVAWGVAHADSITFSRELHSPFSERSLFKRGFRPAEQTYVREIT